MVLAVGLGHMVCVLVQWPAHWVLCLFGDLNDLVFDAHEPQHTPSLTGMASPITLNTDH